MATHLSSKDDYESLLDKYDTWMFDCDGVLWHEDRPIDGAVEVLDILRKRGKHTCYSPSDHSYIEFFRKAASFCDEQRQQISKDLQGQV